jgi:hypothetical protein
MAFSRANPGEKLFLKSLPFQNFRKQRTHKAESIQDKPWLERKGPLTLYKDNAG